MFRNIFFMNAIMAGSFNSKKVYSLVEWYRYTQHRHGWAFISFLILQCYRSQRVIFIKQILDFLSGKGFGAQKIPYNDVQKKTSWALPKHLAKNS